MSQATVNSGMIRIAIIQTAFPGDVILSTAVFEALKEKYPGCHTAAVVRPESVCLLDRNPYIERIIPFDKYSKDKGIAGVLRIAAVLKGFDEAIIIQRHLRSAFLPFWARIPRRVGFDNTPARLLYTERIHYRDDIHEVQRCLSLLGVIDNEKKYMPRIYLDQNDEEGALKLLREIGIEGEFAVVAPGSVWPTKRYPHFAEIVDRIYDKFNLPVVIIGGGEDTELAEKIRSTAARRSFSLTGKTNLRQSAAVISLAKIAISNDSAPAHVAAAVGTPVVAIFGPTVPAFGFAPYSQNSSVVDIGELPCRPCSRHGSKKCPLKHFKCMKELGPEEIIAAASLLGRF